MNIVKLEKFLTLPEGTLFMKFDPDVFEGLCSKGRSLEHDFYYTSLTDEIASAGSADFHDKLDLARETGEPLLMDFDVGGRDGCFDKNQLFAVYDKRDVEMLTDKLKRCAETAYNQEG